MRKIVLILLALCATSAFAQFHPQANLGYCMYSGSWIPIASSTGTGIAIPPTSVAIYGANSGTYYPLACDSGGHLIPGGACGGDTSGTYPACEVTGILSNALPALTTGYLNWTGTAWAFTVATGGTVTSVGMTMPGVLFNTSVPGSPITSSGTFGPTLATQTANTILAGPSTGSAATPTFRALVSGDIPNNAANTSGNAANVTGTVAIGNGGTGATTAAAAVSALGAASLVASNVFTANQTMPTITSPAASSATDSAPLGPELTTSGTCSGTGWTGTYPNYVAPGTTAPLTCTGFTSGSYYQLVTGITGNTGLGTVTVAIGTAQPTTSASTSSSSLVTGPQANATSLTYTPTSSFNGTVAISAKLISPITTFSYVGKDSTGAVSTTMLYQGLATLYSSYSGGGGSYNTTGNYNSAYGFRALYSNTTGSINTAYGFRALFFNTTGGSNTGEGSQALYFNTTGGSNTAQGTQALYSNTTGSINTAQGYESLFSNTTGGGNAVQGYAALYSNTTGNSNTAQGTQALYFNTTGGSNIAQGYGAGRFISDGSTANATSSNSVYLGFATEAKASGDTNENVIGNAAVGNGSNTTTIGNSSITGTWKYGTQHVIGTAPTTSAGSIAASSTNSDGEITGLSSATTVTITFANSGWTNAAFCTAIDNQAATPVANTAQSATAVTFTFSSLTGNLFYHCGGN